VNYKLNSSNGVANTGLKLRYNLFYDTGEFSVCINYNSSNGEFYQNLFIDGVIVSMNSGFTSPNHKIYNNTFIGGKNEISTGNIMAVEGTHALTNWEWYNNIYYSKNNTYYPIHANANYPPSYCDYNGYYRPSYTPQFSIGGTTYSWGQWRAIPRDGLGRTDNPLFVSYTGDEKGDYKLQTGSPYRNGGRNGITMGCYITGNEQIGAGAGSGSIPPSPPTNLRIVP
jgi:hypothetical protein